jgi:hypothetical protein
MNYYKNGPTFKEIHKDKKYHVSNLDTYYVAVDSEDNKIVGTYQPESHSESTIQRLLTNEDVAEIHVYEQVFEYRRSIKKPIITDNE